MATINTGMEIVFPITTVLNLQNLNSNLTQMRNAVGKESIKINVDLASTTGKSLTEQLGGGENFFNMVQQAAGAVGKLRTEFKLFKDSQGNTIKIATAETKEYRDELGNVVREMIPLKTAEQALAEARIKGAVAEIGSATAEANWRKAAKLTQDEINKEIKAVDDNSKAAEKYLEKSKNMRGPQVEAARKAAQAVLDEGKALKATKANTEEFAGKVLAARDANEKFRNSLEATKAGANVFQNFSTRIANAVQQTIAYSLSLGLVYKAQQMVNDAVRYAIDLNKEMVKIQVLQAEGASTPEEINALAKSFNNLGKEMGASTLEIARGSVEWFRQGRTVEETQKLMRASMMLSKLGAMESADATNYLTSITNAFKIEVSDTVSVVDKLIAVDNIAATSAGELATALRYTSESAALAGVSMEQLVSYIGTVSTVTRQNAEMIGQAFKTMFSRMTLMEGGGTDEEGWTISKVEKALEAVQIQVRNTNDELLPMGDVLEQVAAKWSTLTDRERTNIATAIAGVRQREAFLVLMNNMDKALQYQAAQTDSSGLAMERYGIYLEGVEAKQAKLTASMQELYSSIINSKLIGAFYDIATGIVQTITEGKLLIPILVTILFLLIEINRQQIGDKFGKWAKIIGTDWGGALKSTKNSLLSLVAFIKKDLSSAILTSIGDFKTFGASARGISFILSNFGITVGPAAVSSMLSIGAAIGPLVAILAAAGIGWAVHKKQIEGATKAVNEFIDAQKELRESNQSARDSVAKINELMDKRKEGFDWNAEDAALLADEFERLQEIMPTLDWKWMDGRPFLTQKIDVEEFNKKLNESVEITEKQSHAFYIYAQENIRNYLITKQNYTEELELLRILEEAKRRYNAIGGGDEGAEAAKKYVAGLKEGMSSLPLETQNAINAASNIVTGSSKTIEPRMSGAIKEASANVAKDGETVAAIQQMFLQLISQGLDPVTGELEGWLASLLENTFLGNIPAIQAFVDQAQAVIVNAQEGSRDSWQRMGDAAETVTRMIEEDTEEANKQLEIQIELIDQLISGFNDIADIDTSTAEGKAELTKRILEYQDALNSLEIEGLTVDFKNLYDAETDTWDLGRLQAWVKGIASSKDVVNALKEKFPEIASFIEDFANNSIASMKQLTYEVNVLGTNYTLNAQQMGTWNDWLAQSLFNLAKDGTDGIKLVADNGRIITVYSVQDIDRLVKAGIISENNFAAQAARLLAQYSATAANIIKKNLGNLLKGLPMAPPISAPPMGGGGGGGGGGENPQIKALEKEIKEHEKIKHDLEHQIRDYEKQKRAIDDLIEPLEDEVEVLEEQIELLEEQIKPLEEQKDALDEQLDAYNEWIDAQKESLELQKEEADFQKELEEKHKKVGKTRALLAIASLDDSEEGQRRRWELEEQLAEDEEDLNKTQEERKYDLQMRALDDAQKAFEDFIDAQKKLIDDQIKLIEDQIKLYEDQIHQIEHQIELYEDQKEAIDDLIEPLRRLQEEQDELIEKHREEIEAIRDANEEIGGGGSAAWGTVSNAVTAYGENAYKVLDYIKLKLGGLIEQLGLSDDALLSQIQHWIDMGATIEEAIRKAQEYIFRLEAARELAERLAAGEVAPPPGKTTRPTGGGGGGGGGGKPGTPVAMHSGGIVADHEKDSYKGRLKDTEVFAKLLKGEYVASEEQMRKFIRSTLPNIAKEISRKSIESTKEQIEEIIKSKIDEREKIEATIINGPPRPPSSGGGGNIHLWNPPSPSLDIEKINIISPPRPPEKIFLEPISRDNDRMRGTYRDLNFDIDVTVEGSLDDNVLPKLKKAVMKEINKNLERRGLKRTADNFAI